MLLQPDKSYFILETMNGSEAKEAINNWKLMKNSEVNNKQKKKMGISKIFYQFGISSARDLHTEY